MLNPNLSLKKFIYIKLFYVFLVIITACDNINNHEKEINSIDVIISVDRFDRVFDSLSKSNIINTKNKYPFFFPNNFSDSFWLKKSNDTLYDLLQNAVENKFGDLEFFESEITNFFKHLKYEFPGIKYPKVYSIINNVDYENKLILADSLLIISIDSYLGNNSLYDGIPSYIKKDMDISFLLSHIAEKYAQKLIPNNVGRDFLSKMIYYGKQLYFKDIIIPDKNDANKIGYLQEEINWVNENELFIWQYIIEKQLLYSTDHRLDERFLLRSPFSKFYLEIDNDSPGRIGQWIGWQIVRSYSKEYPDKGLQQILLTPANEIFKNSKYKPKKIWQ